MENIPLKIGTSAFKTESLTGKNVEINYKSGGRYKGDMVDNRKCGKGSMYWPDGSVYHGDFVNDQRSGKGNLFIISLLVSEVFAHSLIQNPFLKKYFPFA